MNVTIARLGGDGIGPEVAAAASEILEASLESHGRSITWLDALLGGAAIDECGDPFPDATRSAVDRADAVFLGAVGGPKWDDPTSPIRPEQGLLRLRSHLGVFANLRPIRIEPTLLPMCPLKPEIVEGTDLIIVRELTGGVYFGAKRLEGDRAVDECVYTEAEVERIARVAFDLARRRSGRVCSVDKANVLETSRLWRRVVTRVQADEYPDVRLEHQLVDSMAMHLLTRPRDFDVVLTENMFGDILSDEASVLAGSLGMLPSASLGGPAGGGTGGGMYEPCHGSAPDIAGRGVANPYAAILSMAMLVEHSLGLVEAATEVRDAVSGSLRDGIATPDIGGSASTREVTAAVRTRLGVGVVS